MTTLSRGTGLTWPAKEHPGAVGRQKAVLDEEGDGAGAEQLFFVIHEPVVPYNARADWHVLSRPKHRVQRERLLGLLGRHGAIVLGGHLHHYGLVTRATPQGAFVQVGANSVVSSEDPVPRMNLEGVDRYGPDLVKLEPKFTPGTLDARRELLEQEKAYTRHFEVARATGHTLFKVYADRVVMEFFPGFGSDVWRRRDVVSVRAVEA